MQVDRVVGFPATGLGVVHLATLSCTHRCAALPVLSATRHATPSCTHRCATSTERDPSRHAQLRTPLPELSATRPATLSSTHRYVRVKAQPTMPLPDVHSDLLLMSLSLSAELKILTPSVTWRMVASPPWIEVIFILYVGGVSSSLWHWLVWRNITDWLLLFCSSF